VDPTPTDSIRLTVPASSAAVRIARAGAAGLATRAGFTYHEVEQLRLAVGEAAALLAPDPVGDGTLSLTFAVEPDALHVDLYLVEVGSGGPATAALPTTSPGAAPGRAAVPSIAAAVLDAAVDSWQVSDGGRRLMLDKRAAAGDDEDD
jgi:serine/threonine-protein kinase RsbW